MSKKFKMMLLLALALLPRSESFSQAANPSVKTKIIIPEGGSREQRASIQSTLTTVIQTINQAAASNRGLESLAQYFTPTGFATLQRLFENYRIHCLLPEVKTNLVYLAISGDYEVRNIPVNLKRGGPKQTPVVKDLVFTLDADCKIVDLHFALEQHEYARIFPASELADKEQRWQILRFVEQYRMAYNNRDVEYLDKVFSDDALVIVGLVIRKALVNNYALEHNTLLEEEEIRLVQRSKREYLERLKEVFKKNSWIEVNFAWDSFALYQHPRLSKIYGVHIKQTWNSTSYSDSGYLFLLFDFTDSKNPQIHVRAWQSRPFSDGTFLNIGTFKYHNLTQK